ncbi:methyltransferase [Amycolatopsis sp. K13G38]|uniref:Methyltransferase n=2 Tax=Amycolatopsis acididurans TaxID=2724524 RepID=A0ABX1JBN0_9PSEU|nr:methyltransferase [Amycolatopsis acididurans]
MMSAERAACLREWQERAYRRGRRARQDVTYLGCELVIPPGVMPITPVSNLLGQAVLNEVGAGERVLDMGTGSGVNAILAASQGASVLAVDINPDAVTTARNNVRRNGFEDLVEVRENDVFGAVEGAFDLIVFDPPFRWFRPRDSFEMASTDENYAAMTRFFGEARTHLTPGGRMLVFFGTTGDLAYLLHLAEGAGFSHTVLAERESGDDAYFTYRMSLSAPRPSRGRGRLR